MVADRLAEQSAVLAKWFVAGCALGRRRQPENWPELLAHTGRDVMDRAFEHFDVPKGHAVPYQSLVAELLKVLPDDLDKLTTLDLQGKKLKRLKTLAAAHRRGTSERVGLDELAAAAGRPIPPMLGARLALDRLWQQTRHELVRAAHLRGRDAAPAAPQSVLREWGRLEQLLAAQLQSVPFWDLDEELQAIARTQRPTREDLTTALSLMRGDAITTFFEALQSAHWLPLMREQQLFDEPEPPILLDRGYRLPAWPLSRYLARIAAADPSGVVEVIEALPATDNGRIYDDLIGAALQMPAVHAARVAALVPQWLNIPYPLEGAVGAAKLAARLALDGEVDAGFDLAREVFALAAEPVEGERVLGPGFDWRHRFTALYSYEEGLQEAVPALREAAPLRALELLAGLLADALGASRVAAEEPGPEDDSWLWRKAIEEHEQDVDNSEPHDQLISAIRDTAGKFIAAEPQQAAEVFALLAQHADLIFRRLSLHLLRVCEFPGADQRRREVLLDRELFDDHKVHRELYLLQQEHFGALGRADKDVVLQWIDQGPDIEAWARGHENFTGEAATPDELQQYADHWRLRRLHAVRDYLAGPWRDRYDELVVQYGVPDHPEFLTYHSVGFTSVNLPVEPARLRAMPIDEVLELTRAWMPAETHALGFAARVDGLAQALQQSVSEDPAYWSAHARVFANAPVMYGHYALSGFAFGAATGRNFTWEPVLDLAEAVLETPGEGPPAEEVENAHRTVASLLASGFWRGNPPPPALRERVWQLIACLAIHRGGPEGDAEWTISERHAPPPTVRSHALDAAVGYAVQVTAPNGESPDDGLTRVPEVRELVEAALDPRREPSCAGRSLLAYRLPTLAWLERGWAESLLPRLFATDLTELSDAAWAGYLLQAPFARDTDELLLTSGAYDRVVETLPARADASAQLRHELGYHLVLAVLWRLPVAREMWERWLLAAPEGDRAAVIAWVGGALGASPPNDISGFAPAMEELWRARLAAAPDGDTELAAFGTWFVAEILPATIAAGLLLQTVERSHGQLDNLRGVLTTADTVVREAPQVVLDVVRVVLHSDAAEQLVWHRDRLRNLLAVASASDEREVRDRVDQLIHELGERGLDLRDATAEPRH